MCSLYSSFIRSDHLHLIVLDAAPNNPRREEGNDLMGYYYACGRKDVHRMQMLLE